MRKVALLGAALLACAGVGTAEERHAGLPAYMKVSAVLVVSPDRVLVAGHTLPDGSLGPIQAREPRIYAFERGPATLAWGEGVGWIIAAAGREGTVWAVRARLRPEGSGSLYDLLLSLDGGVSWRERGPVPATSLTSVAVAGGGTGWAHGANNLWRTEDDGVTWVAISAPGRRDSAREQLVALGPQTALLAGTSLLRTDDGGDTWRVLTTDRVDVTDGRFVGGAAPGGVRVGRLQPNGVHWGATFPGTLLAKRVVSEGERVTVLASEVGDRPGSGPVLLRSTDGGATLAAEPVRGPLDASYYELAGPDGLVFVDQGRTLRVRTLPH